MNEFPGRNPNPRRRIPVDRADTRHPEDGAERTAQAADDAPVNALLDLLTESLTGLPDVLERRNEERRARDEAAQKVLAAPELKKAGRQMPAITKNITATREEMARRDAEAEQAIAALRGAGDEWLAALKGLRGGG